MAYNPFPKGSERAKLFDLMNNGIIDDTMAKTIVLQVDAQLGINSQDDALLSTQFAKWVSDVGASRVSTDHVLRYIKRHKPHLRTIHFSDQAFFEDFLTELMKLKNVGRQKVATFVQFLDEKAGTGNFPCKYR